MQSLERRTPDVHFAFGHETGAPGEARQLLTSLLRSDDLLLADVMLVASELVSNVVNHTDDGGSLDAWNSDPFRLEVSDHEHSMPATSNPKGERGGWGLAIVAVLARRWGVVVTAQGKTVWLEFDRRDSQQDG